MPPPIISSRPATPVDSRTCPGGGQIRHVLGSAGEHLHACAVIRMVCSPGIGAMPALFTTWSFRTTELRSTSWESQRMPSATVKTGLPELLLLVFADEERRHLPGRQVQREPLHEMLELAGPVRPSVLRAHQRPERVDDDDTRDAGDRPPR